VDLATTITGPSDAKLILNDTGFPWGHNSAALLVGVSDLGSGLKRFFYLIPETVTSVATLTVWVGGNAVTAGDTVAIDKVSRWAALPFIGTARQKVLALIPGGSVRTQGSIKVAHATDSLGRVIVYTYPAGSGYQPPLRPWLIASDAVSSDSTLLSGEKNFLDALTAFRIPMAAAPTGRVELWAWLMSTTTRTININADMYACFGATPIGEVQTTGAVSIDLEANVWKLAPIGAFVSPPTQVGATGSIQIDLDAAETSVSLDEAYLFATDEGRLTVVDCGSAPASNRLWIDAPSLDVPMGAIYRGVSEDRSDSWHAGTGDLTDCWQVHDFEPTGTSVFVATQNAEDAETSLEHYRRFHTHVAREE
jgi:hypothetical protein